MYLINSGFTSLSLSLADREKFLLGVVGKLSSSPDSSLAGSGVYGTVDPCPIGLSWADWNAELCGKRKKYAAGMMIGRTCR